MRERASVGVRERVCERERERKRERESEWVRGAGVLVVGECKVVHRGASPISTPPLLCTDRGTSLTRNTLPQGMM